MSDSLLTRVFKDPLALFLLVGAMAFGGFIVVEKSSRAEIELSEETRARLIEEQSMLIGRPLTADEEDALLTNFIDREILFQEAISQGMHLVDPRTRESLIERQRLKLVGYRAEPQESDLLDFYSSNLDLYQSETEYSFEQVLVMVPPRDPNFLTELLANGLTPPDMPQAADYRSVDAYGESAVRALIGQSALEALMSNDIEVWFGPVQSPTGWLFLRKTGEDAPRLLKYLDVRDQVRIDFMAQQDRDILNEAMSELRERYDVQPSP